MAEILNSKDNINIIGATLLSLEEAEKALSLLSEFEKLYPRSWWLRTPGSYDRWAHCVARTGIIYTDGSFVNTSNRCVRPALKIKINDPDIQKGDTFLFGGYEFKVISEDLAWMYKNDIGFCPFRYDAGAEDANDYEASDIKKYVEEWLDKAIHNTTGSEKNGC